MFLLKHMVCLMLQPRLYSKFQTKSSVRALVDMNI